MDNRIEFSTNWNKKLDNDCFTTIRLHSDKYKIGEKYEVFFKGPKKVVEIVSIKKLLLEEINEWVAYLDTGYSRQECINIIKKMYSKYEIDWDTKRVLLILCKTVK